jgi:hypothetical protein
VFYGSGGGRGFMRLKVNAGANIRFLGVFNNALPRAKTADPTRLTCCKKRPFQLALERPSS